jgi:hypothetical protein
MSSTKIHYLRIGFGTYQQKCEHENAQAHNCISRIHEQPPVIEIGKESGKAVSGAEPPLNLAFMF